MKEVKGTNGLSSKQKVLRPWKTLKSRKIFTAKPWIQLSVEKVRLPDGRVVDDFYQTQFLDCVIIFAQTMEGKVLMERQYKHGIRKVTLTLPTGGINEGEEPLRAAQRELEEETGCVSKDWQSLGSFASLGNMGGAHVHMFQARDVKQVTQPTSGDLEEMEIILMDLQELIGAIRTREISILSTVSAILLATHPSYVKQ